MRVEALIGVVALVLGPLLRVPEEPRHWYGIIAWWELRRIPYNVIVGIVGLVCVYLYLVVDALPPRLPADELDFDYFLVISVSAVLANVLYTGGWVCEVMLRSATRQQVRHFGPSMLRLGLLLSLAMPVSAVAFNALYWLSRVVGL